MSKYREIPKDLLSVKTKLAFGLTRRQIICFGTAAAVGLSIFFLTRPYVGNTASMFLMMLLMAPGFTFALFEKNGLPLEACLKNFYNTRYGRPGLRKKSSKETNNLDTEGSALNVPTVDSIPISCKEATTTQNTKVKEPTNEAV